MDGELTNFYALEDALLRVDADFSAAEVHGINSAVLSINGSYDFQSLKTQVLSGAGDPMDVHYQEISSQLADLYSTIHAQLNANDLGYQLLLPDDHDDLHDRLGALQKWCQGFAYGLALSGLTNMDDLPEDSREWTQDVINIGASGDFDLEDEEASEEALQDLIEFLRMGTLMMNEEMQPVTGAPDITDNQSSNQ